MLSVFPYGLLFFFNLNPLKHKLIPFFLTYFPISVPRPAGWHEESRRNSKVSIETEREEIVSEGTSCRQEIGGGGGVAACLSDSIFHIRHWVQTKKKALPSVNNRYSTEFTKKAKEQNRCVPQITICANTFCFPPFWMQNMQLFAFLEESEILKLC